MSETLSLLDWRPAGVTAVHPRDTERLGDQLKAVFEFVKTGEWVTLRQIAAHVGAPEASVSARLRDIRRLGFTVEREYVLRGLHRYRVLPNASRP